MPNPENIKDKGFDKRPENINRDGRPKKIYTILKEKGFSKDDITTAFGEMLWYTLPELKKVYEDEDKPAITRIVANQIFTALKNSDYSKIKEIMQYVIGMPVQKIEDGKADNPIQVIVSEKGKKLLDEINENE
jgi:uncharacterized protein (UPF0297 family)